MEKEIHNQLVEILKLQTPDGQTTVDFLGSITSLSREAAYRRLRREINFTLSEITAIANALYISLDKMAGIDKKFNYMFHMKEFENINPFEAYYELQAQSLDVYRAVKDDPAATFYYAGSVVPTSSYHKYPNIMKHSFFRFLNHIPSDQKSYKFCDIKIPDKILDLQKMLYEEARKVQTCFIIGQDVIMALLNEMRYFLALDMITAQEIESLVKDIRAMLDDMEASALNGLFQNTGQQVQYYVSNNYFDGNYSYMSSSKFHVATIHLFGINQLNCIDPAICEAQKVWIASLVSHSTLMSASGKLTAAQFFDSQRKLLAQYDPVR